MAKSSLILATVMMFAAEAALASPISGTRQLTFEGARAGEGYFNGDGSAMVFQSEREEGNPFYQMYTLDMETGDVERVSPGVGKTTCGWLHPNGKKALFASTQFDPEAEAKMQAEIDFRASGQTRRYSWDYDPEYELVETVLETGTFRRLTNAKGYDAEGAYSPDGSRIVFASNRAAYTQNLSPEDAARLDRDPAYFMDIYVMDADGGNVTRLTTSPGYDGGSFWDATGEKITWRRFSEDGARAEVFTMNADGSDERQLTDLGVMSWAPYFHPSGEYLIFSTNLQGFSNFELYLVDKAGMREPVRVSDRAGFDGLPAFTPDGKKLSWTSNGTPQKASQIFIADWDHDAAMALLAEAPMRAAAVVGEDAITTADLRRHVEALTTDEMAGRMTGTAGERLATAYVADAFAAMGLTPAGQGGTYFDEFSFTAGVSRGEDDALMISLDGEALTLSVDEWTPLAFSHTGPAEEAGVAFVGYGLVAPADGDAAALDSYGEVDVTGKWALIWRGIPGELAKGERTRLSRFADLRYKASVAKSRGAAGVIFASPPRLAKEQGLARLSYEPMSGEAGLPVVAVDADNAARMLSIVKDFKAVTAELEAGKPVAMDLIGVAASAEIALNFEHASGRNVVARLDLDGLAADDPAAAPPLYIGGHVDHLGRGEGSGSLARGAEKGGIHYGADDNASGVAATLEAAQKLSADHANGKLKGARDIIFAAWSGEELGLIGATRHVEGVLKQAKAEDLSDHVAAYINLDMVGRLEDKVVVSGLASSPIWAREVERRNAVVGLPITTSDDTYLPTDSTAFYLNGAPILSIFTGAHEDYHRPADTAEKLNYEGLKDITRLTALIARSIAKTAEQPAYVKVARPEAQRGRRVSNVFLGTIPDYAQQGRTGVAISGVVKDSPAEAAGMQGGDAIIGLAGEDLANIYDFVRALNGLKAGEEIDLVVERGGEAINLKITPKLRD
ncbi:MAG: M28 family peptidase [Pikeienuella sp.]